MRPVSSASSPRQPAHAGLALVVAQRVPDEPESRGPQPHKQSAPLGVAALALVDSLGAYPEDHAETDRAERQRVQVPVAQAAAVEGPGQHPRPQYPPGVRSAHGVGGHRCGYSTGVPRRPPLTRRLATVARWPTGVGPTSRRYLRRTTPLHRSEEPGTAAEDACPALPPDVPAHDVQRPEDGVGALFHRRYRARI